MFRYPKTIYHSWHCSSRAIKLGIVFVFLFSPLFAQKSVLEKGQWIKIEISQDGIYKLDKRFFDKYAPEFSQANPKNIQIFAGHLKALPHSYFEPRIQDLQEISVKCNDTNNRWDMDDEILFWAEDPHQKSPKHLHRLNPYSNTNYYYITIADHPAKAISSSTLNANFKTIDNLSYYQYHEQEKTNLLNSGTLWLGDYFRNTYKIEPQLEDIHSDFKFYYALYPLGNAKILVDIKLNGQINKRDTLSGAPYNPNDSWARYQRISNPHQREITTLFSNLEFSLGSEGFGNAGTYIDYWAASYNRKLRYIAKRTLVYYNQDQQNSILNIIDKNTPTQVWEIKDAYTAIDISENLGLSQTDSKVVIFDKESILQPRFHSKIENQNILAFETPQQLIVFPEKFRKEAQKLIHIKQNVSSSSILGVSIQEIYNQFSSGKTDPTALRNYVKFINSKSPKTLNSLLLLGDATFDYKNNLNYNFVDLDLLIPTFESHESLEPIYSYASDDYFAFHEEHEGVWPEGKSVDNQWISTTENHTLDIAVGRIPAKSNLELVQYIEKYKRYITQIEKQNWQNKIGYIADNRDFNLHVSDAELLAQAAAPGFEVDKLYLDAYPTLEENGNYTIPEAHQKLLDWMNHGKFLITYLGHGSETALTNEKLWSINDIQSLQNIETLPIWFTATCQFGKFDNPGQVSAAELMLLKPQGGAIALLTTTRPVYSSSNQRINQAFIHYLSNSTTLGEAFRQTKNHSAQGELNRNFTLLGDPNLPLPTIQNKIFSDTLKSFQSVNLTFTNSEIDSGFAKITVYKVPQNQQTHGYFADGPKKVFSLQTDELINGVFPIVTHQFQTEWILPKIEDEGETKAIIKWYTADSTLQKIESIGPIYVLHTLPEEPTERIPPEIVIENQQSHSLLIKISDPSGLQTQKIDLYLNQTPIPNWSRYIIFMEGNKTIHLSLPLIELAPGTHSVKVQAVDTYNNTADKSFSFDILNEKPKLLEVKVFPNPITDYASFRIKHNQAGKTLKMRLRIMDETGRIQFQKETQCKQCPEYFNWYEDFYGKSFKFKKLIYQIELMSPVDSPIDQTSGRLFFWKS